MKSFRRRLIFQLTTSFVIIAALTTGTVYFGKSIARYSNQLVDNRRELIERSTTLDTLASLSDQYNAKAKRYLDALYNVVPKKNELFVINLNQDFQSLATQTGLDYSFSIVDEIRPGGENFGSIRFKLTLRGNLENVLKFIKAVHQFRYLTAINGFTIVRQDEAKSEIVLKGQVFYR
ncbi:MAG: type 4a pilus biogenesis protein PilO [Patescibacteria group bacterium]|nr:type 4a pilus biogenesis protein PilO [Patescibacteria group bacterium]